MRPPIRPLLAIVAIGVAAALVLSACSTSGSGSAPGSLTLYSGRNEDLVQGSSTSSPRRPASRSSSAPATAASWPPS